MKTILLAVVLCLAFAHASANPSRDRNREKYRLVCYLGSWAYYRHGDGKYDVTQMDPHLCTHLIYGFAKLENDRITPYDTYLDLKENWGVGYFDKFNALRQSNPGLTTLIAIGGWNEGSQKYSDMARDPNRRRVFVNSVMDFLQRYGFDGLDFDWEYPASREGSRPEDKDNFVQVLKELKEAFQPYGYLLTAAVSAGRHTIEPGYDIPQVAKYLDFINLMAYDYHGTWDQVTGHNAPLFARPEEGPDAFLNTNYSVNYWLNKGFPKDKMVLGMPLYGRCFQLANPANAGLGVASTGPGQPGRFTNEPGMMGYHELCSTMRDESHLWTLHWDEYLRAPYAHKGSQWCGFDNPRSLGEKVDYLKSMGLSGGMVWSLETDDFNGRCSSIKYPLLRTVKDKLADHSPVRPTIPPATTLPSIQSTTTKPDSSEWCDKEGTFGFRGECVKYYDCIRQRDALVLIPRSCPTGTFFHMDTKQCLHPNLVPNCITATTSSPRPTTRAPVATPESPTTRFEFPSTSERLTTKELFTSPAPPSTTPMIVDQTTEGEHVTTSGEFRCQTAGYFPNPVDCTRFYKCQQTTIGFQVNHFICPDGLVYNRQKLTCDYPNNVPECQGKTGETKMPKPVACGSQGYHPYPGDCTLFVHCMSPLTSQEDWVVFKCPAGLYYKSKIHACDYSKPDHC